MNKMSRITVAAAFSLVLPSLVSAQLDTEQDKLSYVIGMDIGNSLKQLNTEFNLEAMAQGIKAILEGETPLLEQDEAEQVKQAFFQKVQAEAQQKAAAASEELAAMGQKNLEEGQAFLAENKTKEGVVETDSGLQYEVLEEGDGSKPQASDTVTVHYRGTLLDGTVFDSSITRGQPATFTLNQVIAGWTEGVQLMPVGSKYKFFIPSNLAYGEQGAGGRIGPNSTLIFEVELLEIK